MYIHNIVVNIIKHDDYQHISCEMYEILCISMKLKTVQIWFYRKSLKSWNRGKHENTHSGGPRSTDGCILINVFFGWNAVGFSSAFTLQLYSKTPKCQIGPKPCSAFVKNVKSGDSNIINAKLRQTANHAFL